MRDPVRWLLEGVDMKRGLMAACAAALIWPAAAGAGGNLGLNQVWSRLADINGELGSIESAEFSPDSERIVSGSKFDNTVRMFRTADGHQLWRVEVPQEIERVAFTRDGAYVASVSEDFMMRVFDADTGELITEYEHEDGIDSLAASHDGRFMVSGQERGPDGTGPVRVFSTEDWSLVRTVLHGDTVNEIDFTSDDRLMASVGHPFVKLWDTETGELVRQFDIVDTNNDSPSVFVNGRFSPDDRYLAAGDNQGFIYIWEVETGERVRRLNKTGQKLETISWTGDGRYLFSAGHGATIDFYAAEHLLNDEIDNDAVPFAMRVPVSDALEYMDMNAQGTLVTTAHQDGTVQLWTYMSDDPLINERRHREVRRLQDMASADR
ncbi:MAG: hypothetical protein MI723_11140 [Caulobacterales bacterium]|nr:hypothetical protein [Caulobacterales bacterium]